MPSLMKKGKYTIKDLINITFDSKYKNRDIYRKRDKIKSIYIRKIKQYNSKDLKKPTYILEAISQSTPQYGVYIKKKVTKYYKKGKKTYTRKSQRSIKHNYNIYFRIYDPNGSINSYRWKVRLGEDRKWRTKKDINIKLIKSKNNPRGKYESIGDYNAQKYQINADWIFRCAYWYRDAGHSYNVRHTGNKVPKISKHIFLPKHLINFFDLLIKSNILADVEPIY